MIKKETIKKIPRKTILLNLIILKGKVKKYYINQKVFNKSARTCAIKIQKILFHEINVNPTQDGLFRGYSRMGGGPLFALSPPP